jgi:hypothetical protein
MRRRSGHIAAHLLKAKRSTRSMTCTRRTRSSCRPVYLADARRLFALLLFSIASLAGAAIRAETGTDTRQTQTTAANTGKSSPRPAPGTCAHCVRPLDQIWLISTRSLGCTVTIDEPPNFHVRRRSAEGLWISSSIGEFLASDDPGIPTCIVIHGNQVDYPYAIEQGMLAYRQLTAGLPADHAIRFVIWSWPSDRVHGILKDVRLKASRTPNESKYLAWTLRQLNSNTQVRLVGFSFGARIATGALHVVAGGDLNGFSLAPASGTRTPVRAVLVAAALHNDWLAEGRPHGEALEIVDAMLLINNSCDAALKRYRFLDSCRDAEALGYTGPAGWSPHYAKIREVDACCDLGKAHDWNGYLNSGRYAALMRQHLWSGIAGPLAGKGDDRVAIHTVP